MRERDLGYVVRWWGHWLKTNKETSWWYGHYGMQFNAHVLLLGWRKQE